MKGIHKFDIITCGSMLIVTLITLGFFYYSIDLYQKETFDDKNLKDSISSDQKLKKYEFVEPYSMKRIVINLPSNTSRLRFLELEMSLETIKPSQMDKLKDMETIIKDAAISVGGAMTPDELNSLSGKVMFEEKLKEKIRLATSRNIISRIFYRRFIVQ
ncbi:MAG: hypothetical protein CME61_06415 [Halobacteriovoraceae bacterium]|nr:hypothetical protein [Halobacteriovoraceae bacterium]